MFSVPANCAVRSGRFVSAIDKHRVYKITVKDFLMMYTLYWCAKFTCFLFFSFFFLRYQALWNVTPCRRVDSSRRFEDTAFRLDVILYQSTRCTFSEYLNVQHYPSGRHKLCISAFLSRIYKSKAVPLQAWTGPEGSRKLRLPDFVTTAQVGGRLSALRTGFACVYIYMYVCIYIYI